MNHFAGIIPYHPSADANGYLKQLRRRFPKGFRGPETISTPQLQAYGHFEASALNASVPDRALYLDGEIFNTDELLRSLKTPPGPTQPATILHALILERGIDAVATVNGQFLIVYIDIRTGSVHLLSDHAGVQQVFYYEGKDFFLFASDIRFLLAHPHCPSEIDWESSLRRPHPHTVLSSYRSYATWFKDIYLLPEATDCRIQYTDKTVTRRTFWNGLYDYAPPAPDDQRSAATVMEEYMALLDDAVQIRTRDSDKAYSFLSGGLDSSAICALAAKGKPLDSYSIITQTTCLEDTTSACHSLAQDLGFTNMQFLIPYHELTFNKTLWKQRIWRTESPVNHTDALTKNLLHYAIGRKDADVPYVLTGTGSDQYNGGLVRWIVNDEATEGESATAFFDKVRETAARKLISRDDEGLWRMRGLIRPRYLAGLAGEAVPPNYWMHYVQSALHIETYSLLWDELRAASAHGRSVRFPFLDYRFTPFIACVPLRLHGELFYDKQILRTPAKKILPDYITAKSKAPSFIPGYDSRFRLFEFLTSGPDSLLEEAFGHRNGPHPVIDIDHLRARVDAMKRKPEIYEWQELVHIINLGLLEQLGGKDEQDLDFEHTLEAPQEIRFDDPAATKQALQQRLAVHTEDALLDKPLQFAAGCALLQDFRTGTFFLAKNNTLAYEIDDEYAAWKSLLQAIDGAQSTRQILTAQGTGFETIREFFMLALKEQILSLDMAAVPLKPEAAPCIV